ncbi:amino acid ABC transporter permease [Brevibacillus composti]|uniref:Amino acid ABC transporter permease n=1 Tax=Brevibacillus composti TaxID=2796470 RepID=A0A7T5EMK0_9BACL|nr:amino acid ABC transporter permease [Brevibacillus composti]QQE75282.1 amino acid ABC transporter permease [Brevibacillus composti]QUO42309.1 amino acid ABC transporter permease [Brevibacillus composti]
MSNSYLQEGELVLIVLILTFAITIWYAKRKKRKQ